MNFKVGDYVRIMENAGTVLSGKGPEGDYAAGDIVRIYKITEDEDYEVQSLDGTFKYFDQSGAIQFFYDYELELAQPYLNEQKLKKVLGLVD